MKNKKIYVLMACLAIMLAGCGLNLAKKASEPEVKKEPVVNNNVATSSEKIATTTEIRSLEATSTPRVRDKIKNWYIYEEPDADFEIKNSTSTIANGHKAVYNEIYEAGVDSVGMSASIAKKLRANPSCSLLNIYYQKKNNDSLFWLPHEFFNTKLCGVVKNGDNVIFYAIGKYKGYETSWYLMPGILILTPDAMIVAENLVPNMDIYLGNWDNEYSKNHKNLDFGSKEWFSYDKSKGEKIDSLLNNPTKEMKDYFIKLKGIANSVVMD